MRAVGGNDDVAGAQVAVNHPARVERRRGLANVRGKARRLLRGQALLCRHEFLERLTGNEVVHDNELVGQRVRGLHLGKTSAAARLDEGPDALIGEFARDLLSNERASAVDGHELGHATGTASEHALDAVHIVDAHGMHDLLVVQNRPSFLAHQRHSHSRSTRRRYFSLSAAGRYIFS